MLEITTALAALTGCVYLLGTAVGVFEGSEPRKREDFTIDVSGAIEELNKKK